MRISIKTQPPYVNKHSKEIEGDEMRIAAKVDANQAEIVSTLRSAGISAHSTASIGKGFPDLICAKLDRMWLIEVKGPKGKLTDDQVEFMKHWQGDVHIARSPDDALRIVGILK